jgi:phosphopantetheinyl transferase (holo-ACP synthase)
MHWWHLSKSLLNPNDPEWDLLTRLSLGAEVHPDRRQSFLLSRNALGLCLTEAGRDLPIRDLMLKNYSQIQGIPEYVVSLSHTKNCGAAMLAPKGQYRSVGIDLEHSERVVKESIIERVRHPHDLKRLRNIELWSLKEAAFKALMNSGNLSKAVEFSSIIIEEKFWSHPPSGLKGVWELNFTSDYVTALAFLEI